MKIKNLKEQIKKQNNLDFNYYGGYTMYAYKFSDEFNLEKNSKREEFLDKLKKIDSKYSLNQNLDDNKNLSENKSAEEPKQILNFLDKIYQSQKDFKKTDIFDEVMKEFDKSENDEQIKIQNEFDNQIFSLKNERSLLEQQQNMALASFDISYAAKLASEIASIDSEISKKKEEFMASKSKDEESLENNKVLKENGEGQDILQLVEKLGQEEVDKMKHKEKYDVVKSYLSEMTKQQAVAELEDERYKNDLGDYYETLCAETFSREK